MAGADEAVKKEKKEKKVGASSIACTKMLEATSPWRHLHDSK
jgi:hypothetical protein